MMPIVNRVFLVSLIFLSAGGAYAAKTYRIVALRLKTDSTGGTCNIDGQTVGQIVGGNYIVRVLESAQPNDVFFFPGSVSVSPTCVRPSTTTVANVIRTDAINRGIEAKATTHFNERQTEAVRSEVSASTSLPANGISLTIP